MKRGSFALSLVLFVQLIVKGQGGTSCADAIPIPMDSVTRSYTVSTSTGANLICTSTGTTPITYFTVTSNSSAQDFILNITGPGGAVEVAFYNGTTCNNGALEPTSSFCLFDGNGLCAPAENFVITPNTTYTIRVKTQSAGSIQICGYYYSPTNNTCLTATEIGTVLTFDNDATNKPGTGVTPAQLCTASLENTSFYYYTVETTGVSSVSFENVNCDNEPDINYVGYGFGLFTGTCGSLTNIACYSGPGWDVQFAAPSLPAGTRVYVAVDGVSGSNCYWGIRGINAMVLASEIKNFTGWKMSSANLLKWTTLDETSNSYYEIQRSENRRDYKTIGSMSSYQSLSGETSYEFEDKNPPFEAYYRIKYFKSNNQHSYTKVIALKRTGSAVSRIELVNPVNDQLNMRIYSQSKTDFNITIVNVMGQVILRDRVTCNSGLNSYRKAVSSLPTGTYRIVLSDQNSYETASFIRIRN